MTLRRSRRLAIALVVLLGVLVAYASCVEPRWLEVTHHVVRAPVRAPLTIAHVSDLHTRGLGAIEQATLDALREAKPDAIVISGDLYNDADARDAASDIVLRMSALAPLGVYYAPGNWEHWMPRAADGAYISSVSARALVNEATRIRDDVWIAGFDDATAGSPHRERALAAVPADVAVLALFHSPAYIDTIAPDVDVAFAGHSHGGQVRLPFIGALWLPPGVGPYVAGWYRVRDAQLYVSRGIGTSVLPIRFWCRPELAIVRIEAP